MFIIHVSPEMAGVCKVGGLADVVAGLAFEQSIRGNDVQVILPRYDCMKYDRIFGFTKTYRDLWVPFYGDGVRCDVYFGFVDGVKCFFIDARHHRKFFSRGAIYGQQDDPERFAFFSKAALEFMLKAGKHPDIIHAHDWQTSLVPVSLFETYAGFGMSRPRVCLTIHNVQHQGITGDFVLKALRLNSGALMNHDRLLDPSRPGACNMLKGGIVYSNFVTTVSPTYMGEIKGFGGYGLQGVLNRHASKTGGVLNGVDSNVWNPEVDRHLPFKYGKATLDEKYKNKKALRERLWLRDAFKPIVAVITRLDWQKGVNLIKHALFYSLGHGCQFVLLGTPANDDIAREFWQLKRQFNDNPDCHIELAYNDGLSHLVYAGADMIVVPSLFEPCGLTQMIAMKYGTVPVVRNTGGLADTVFDANYAHKPYEQRNGYVFNNADNPGLESALKRSIGLWYQYPEHFRQLVINGMSYDFSWKRSTDDYLNIYNHIKAK